MSTKKKYGKEKITSSNEDIPLHFPNLTTFDTAENCPAYMKILQRTKGGSVYIKELDSLQREIETIVLSIKKRKENITEESKILTSYQEKDTKKNICNLKSTANGKRSNSVESRPLKKHKSGSSQSYTGRPKAKNSQVVKSESWSNDSAIEIIHKPTKGDAPGRFWASLEPYFSEITQDHLKFIEEWMQSNDDSEEYFEIPSLGKHFAYEWSQKEIEEEKREGAKASENDKKSNSNSSPSTPSEDIIDVEKVEEKNNCENIMNPLSQQLLNALIEEKVIAGLEDTIDASKELPECEELVCIQSNSVAPPTIIKSKCLEDRIKGELIALGVLEESEQQEKDETDFAESNLVDELKEAQASLRMMMQHNFNKKLQLMGLAKEEINKQEIRKKLNVIDAEIMDMLRKIPKKKILSKKEKDNAVRLLNDRKVYVDQLKTLKS